MLSFVRHFGLSMFYEKGRIKARVFFSDRLQRTAVFFFTIVGLRESATADGKGGGGRFGFGKGFGTGGCSIGALSVN